MATKKGDRRVKVYEGYMTFAYMHEGNVYSSRTKLENVSSRVMTLIKHYEPTRWVNRRRQAAVARGIIEQDEAE